MTVKQLKEALKNLPDNMEVAIKQEHEEFTFSLISQAKVINCDFSEDPGGKVLAKGDVLVLTDEI